MPQTTYYLLKPEADVSPVYYSIYCSDGRLRRPTKTKIKTEYWDKEKGWFNADTPTKLISAAKSQLDHITGKVDKYSLHCELNDLPVTKAAIEALIAGQKQQTGTTFLQEYDRLIDLARAGLFLNNKNAKYSKGVIRLWKNNRNLLAEFSKVRKRSIELTALTVETVKDFITWMTGREHAAQNYIGTQVKQWKKMVKFMNPKLPILNDPAFVGKFEDVDKIMLTEEEIQTLYHHNLTASKYHEQVRDRWVFMYCLGVRVGDNMRVDLKHLKKDNITLVNNKTGKKVVIPYHWMLEELLVKYKGLPPSYTPEVINREIKEIAKAAGLTDLFTYKITRKGVTQEITAPKWQLLTNHTSRRSLVSNMIENGIGHDIGGDIVGLSPAMWKKYNKLTANRKAQLAKEMGVFKKKG